MEIAATPAMPLLNQKSTPEQTKQAAKEFEAVFIAQMLQPMFATVEVDPMFGGGSAEEMWRGVMVEEVAKNIANNGGLGLTDEIAQQMLRLQEVNDGTR